jgi:hypothetical protein
MIINIEDEYCWTIFFDNLLAGVYTDQQKAKDHLGCLIADFPKCVKRKETDWMTVYDDSNGEEGGSFFFMTKRKLNVPLIQKTHYWYHNDKITESTKL